MNTPRRLALLAGLIATACLTPPPEAHAQNGPLERRQFRLEVTQDSLEHKLKVRDYETPQSMRVRSDIARAIYAIDTLRWKRRELELLVDLRALDSAANANGLAVVRSSDVPPPVFVTRAPAQRHRLSATGYLVTLGALAVAGGKADHDPGGYDRSAFYRDKFYVHFAVGAGIEGAAEAAGVHPLIATGGACAASFVFEQAQGYPNKRDNVNGCGGALTMAVWRAFWRR